MIKEKQRYFYNALLLTAVAFLMRTVSVSFNVYVSNRVGAEAMGLLSLVGSVYGFAVTLATSGIHLATVRTVSEEEARHGEEGGRRALGACLRYAAFFGGLATLLLFLLARPLGLFVLKDKRTVRALFMLSFTLLPVAICTVMNGYFTAVRRAFKNAAVQVMVEGAKISATGYLLLIISPKTTEGCVLAILLGGAVAEALSLLLNAVLFLFESKKKSPRKEKKRAEKIGVATIALPVAISAYARSGLLAIEHILIPRGLIRFGSGNSAALSAYGTLNSMALPLLLYPAALLTSFSSLLIPEITRHHAAKNNVEIRYIAGRVYQMTLLFSIGAGGIMMLLGGELGNVLYKSDEVAHFLLLLSPLVPIMYLDSATDAMLKGLGEQVYSMNVNILDALISVGAVALLVPRMGIAGYVVTIYITEILNAAFSVTRLLRVSNFRPRLTRLVVKPLLAVVVATRLAALLINRFSLAAVTPSGVVLFLHILLAATLYIFALFLFGALKKDDSSWLFHSIFPQKSGFRARNVNNV